MATSSGDVAKQRESWKHILKMLCFFLCASRGFVLNMCFNLCLFTFDTWNVNDTSSMHWFGLPTSNPYVTYVHNIHLRERYRFLFLSVNLYTVRVGSEEGENSWVAENHTHWFTMLNERCHFTSRGDVFSVRFLVTSNRMIIERKGTANGFSTYNNQSLSSAGTCGWSVHIPPPHVNRLC